MFSRILVPLDGSTRSERALPYAVQLARRFTAQLVLLGVVPPVAYEPPLYNPMIESVGDGGLLLKVHAQQRQELQDYLDAVAHRPEVAALRPYLLKIIEEGTVALY